MAYLITFDIGTELTPSGNFFAHASQSMTTTAKP
jgi:hypothetical protein